MAIGKGLEMKNSTIIYSVISFGIAIGSIMFAGILSDGYMIRIKDLVKNASFENFVGPIISFGYLSESSQIIEHATIGFVLDKFVVDPTPETGWTGDEYFANVISQCSFHSADPFDQLCVICRLKDADGNVIGAGMVKSFDEQYVGSSIVHINIDPDPENQLSNDVQKVHTVQVDICKENGGEGCTPGYWRQTQHFGSWTNPPYSPVVPLTTFRAAFDLLDFTGPITMKTRGGPGGGPAPTKVDTFASSSDDITLLDAIWALGDDQNKMGRHATAALLNDANPIVNFNPVLDRSEIIRLVQVAYGKISDVNGIFVAGDFNDIGDVFAASNDLGDDSCPLGLNPLPGAR